MMARNVLISVRCITMAFLVLQIALSPMTAMASDADPEQDFCVGLPTSTIIVNGLVCKDPETVTVSDFVFRGLATPGNTANGAGSAVTPASAAQFPGLNTQGISLERLDFAGGGVVAPHTHPRASEVLIVLEGSLLVGFVSTSQKLFAATLNIGDVFVFPRGLLHFEINTGAGPALAIAALNSQNPGVQAQPAALFGSGIEDAVLEKAFGLTAAQVDQIKANF
ncbi:hypothetical protein BDL97_14G015400 [Sphagnum fallax]|nr:hypothetical protein BDL97_14G015400 [Sphagnum fallax]